MNTNLKKFLILCICIASSACSTTKVQLNRDLVHQEKVNTINVNPMVENISIELSNSGTTTGVVAGGLVGALIGGAVDSSINSSRKKSFGEIQESTNVMGSNAILKNALTHYSEGNAFGENVIINLGFDNSIKKPYLLPILTPSITMSSNYGVIDILLKTSTTQKSSNNSEKQNQYKGSYSSQQVIESDTLDASKEDNKQYWIDNPIILREKIVDGLYDVAKQFADDFNAASN